MEYRTRVKAVLVIVFVTIVVDQLSKMLAIRWIAGAAPRKVLGSFFVLEYAENPGAILSLGGTLGPQARFWVFTVFVASLLVIMFVAAIGRFKLRQGEIIALALIVGGGVSNLGDRIFNQGLVIDFMNMGLGNLRTGVFNIADLAIVAGAVVLVVSALLARKRKNA